MRFAAFTAAALMSLGIAAHAEEPTFKVEKGAKGMTWEAKVDPQAKAALQKTMKGAEGPPAVGKPVSDFTLTDLDGNPHTLSDVLAQGKVVVLEWFNPDCPFVKKHHHATRSMGDTEKFAEEQGIVWFAVNSGAPGKQGAGQERNEKAREEYKIDYPILLDEEGRVGKAYGAKNTPGMYIISPEGMLLYHGAIDNDSTPQKLGETNYVRKALEEYLAGKAISTPETKPYGCSVKYAT
jgi:peroxiredoxin